MSSAAGHQNEGAEREAENQAQAGPHQPNQIDTQDQADESQNLQPVLLHKFAAVFHRCQWSIAVMNARIRLPVQL